MQEQIAKILVIDDERINIQLLFEGLSDEYSILAASNGVDGLKIAREQSPDLILLDIMLGDVHGHEVCKSLKADPRTQRIPVIFVTAQDTAEDELAGLELGAVDYFKKPFSIPLVRVRVRKQIELKQKTDLLEHLSLIDGLTGVANRRQFDDKLTSSISYTERNHRGLTLLMVDIDYFKQYNDMYGHVKGDMALKTVAKLLSKGASRPLDFVARYGGEEFAILLLDSTLDEGLLVAEKLRCAMENANIPHDGSDYSHLTISIGVSYVDAEHTGQLTPSYFIEDADQCLYIAKRDGRNRVVASHLIVA
ncbi:MAG: diguanylate cyclase [Glaciecola sp.]